MPTQLRLFSTNGSENFSGLEKEVNDWLAAKGDLIQPANSQTATCAIANSGGDKWSQAVVIALWRLFLQDPKEEVNLKPGEIHVVRAARPHLVTNGGTKSLTFLVLQGIGEYDYVPLTSS
jgi:hypothetical protein